MKPAPMSRSTAERRARLARLAFAGLAIGALAVVALGIPRLTAVPTLAEVRPSPARPAPIDAGDARPADRLAVDSQAISDRLMQLSNHPQAPEPPPTTPEDDEPKPPPPPASDEARYLGMIKEPDRRLALVNISGKQHVMAEGEEIKGVKLVSISESAITIHEGGADKQVDRQHRTGSSVSMLGAADGSAPMSGRPSPPGAAEQLLAPGAAETANIVRQQRPRNPKINIPTIPAAGRGSRGQPADVGRELEAIRQREQRGAN